MVLKGLILIATAGILLAFTPDCFKASVCVSASHFKAGDTLHFSISTDGEHGTLTYAWEGEGATDSMAEPLFIVPVSAPANVYTVMCAIDDNRGCSVVIKGQFYISDTIPAHVYSIGR